MNGTDDSLLSLSPNPVEQQIALPVAKRLTEVLKVYGPIVLLLFGLPGNVLSYVVMNQAQFRHTTTSYFIRALAISDNGYLIVRCLQRFLLANFLRPLLIEWNALQVFCTEYLGLMRFTISASRYVLLLMTYDRLVGLLFPLQARAYPMMKIAKILTVIVLAISVSDGCVYLSAQESEFYAHWLCPYYLPGFLGDAYTQYTIVVTGTSCGLLIIANVLIAWSLYSHVHQMKSLQEGHGAHAKTEALQQRSTQNKQISLMLLLASSFYLLCDLPREINAQFWPLHPDLARTFPDLLSLTLEITIFVEALNYAVNFYLYVASCRKFRTTLGKLFLTSDKENRKTTVISFHETNRK